MAKIKLDSLLEFIKFTHLFQKVERVIHILGEDRWENDAEHSFQLAIIAWYIIEHGKLRLNLSKVILMALAHDLVEIHAGDTFFYGDAAQLASKAQREKEAIIKIKEEFPDFTVLHQTIEEYEARQSEESKFVYALDKLIPIFNIYLDGGRTWKVKNITLEQIIKAKTDKIATSPEVAPYFKSIISILEENPQLFNQTEACPVSP